MIWNSNSFHMEELNVDEQKSTMGFQTCTIVVLHI